MYKIRKIITLVAIAITITMSSLSVRAEECQYPSTNMDIKHPDTTEMTYIDSQTASVYKKEKITSYVMNYAPIVYSATRTKTSAYIDVEVFNCSLMTTVQVSEDKDFKRILYTQTVPNKAYVGMVVSDYRYTELYKGKKKTITFARILMQLNYGEHFLSYRKIDITNNPSRKLVTTESVADSIKGRISNKNTRKTIRITGTGNFKLDPNKKYYFRVRNIYDGFGGFHRGYPYRIASLAKTVESSPLKK